MADIGFDASVEVDDGASNTYVAIPDVESITVPSPEVQMFETSHLKSTNKVRTYKAGWTEPGEFSFEAQYTDTTYGRLVTLRGVEHGWKVKFPDDDVVVSLPGVLTKVDASLNMDKAMLTATVKIVGEVSVA